MQFIADAPDFPKDIAAARAVQETLRHRIRIEDDFGAIDTVAGVDCSYDINNNLSRAFIVLLERKSLTLLESVRAELPTDFPYVPGFLSFREIPVVLEAAAKLTRRPDVWMVDGQGIAHPRRIGIAAHLGALTDMPAIGIAKSRLTGRFEEVGYARGATQPLMDKGERIGTVLRSKEKTLPLFISPGHRVGQDTALALVQEMLTRYRLPEPTRLADKLSKAKPATTGDLF